VNEREEIDKWLREHWPDRVFEASDALKGGDFSGAYTLYCSIATCDNQRYILKRYNPLGVSGVQTEKLNYQRFGNHLLFPRLEAFLPKGTDSLEIMAYGILLPFYPNKVAVAGISVVEVLAIGLSMATMLSYFADERLIYFDLRSDSLRVDADGGLHLIDFSDLLTMVELTQRPTGFTGLPVIDRTSAFIPPEGRTYESALNEYHDGKLVWSRVEKVAYAIHPERYQVFTLAGLIIELLVGVSAGSAALIARIARAGEQNDGAFSVEERSVLLDLLTLMQEPNERNRPSFTAVREVFWSLLAPRLEAESIALNSSSNRAAKLLRTISQREADSTSSRIHESLTAYWSTY
jgi:hypothetical protein